MKTNHTILSLLAACSVIPASAATTVTGDNLNIGTNNTLELSSSGTIGYNNTNSQPGSLVVGHHNYLTQYDNEAGTFVLGQYNTVEAGWGVTAGQYNTVFGFSSLTVGYFNYNGSPHTLVGGRGHVLNGAVTLMVW